MNPAEASFARAFWMDLCQDSALNKGHAANSEIQDGRLHLKLLGGQV